MLKIRDQQVQTRELSCDLAVVYDGATDGLPVHPPDLSTRGMFINTRQSLPVGSISALRFRLALSGVELTVRAEVRFCVPGIGVQVEFVDLSDDAYQAIEREMQMSPALAPCPWKKKPDEPDFSPTTLLGRPRVRLLR